jgi:hypothetical protein
LSKEKNFYEVDGKEGSEDAELDNLEESDGDDDKEVYISDSGGGDDEEDDDDDDDDGGDGDDREDEEEGVESDGCSGTEEKKPVKRKCVEVSMKIEVPW